MREREKKTRLVIESTLQKHTRREEGTHSLFFAKRRRDMKELDFDKMFTRKASEFVNRHGEREEEREVKIPEHMLPPPRRKGKDDDENENAGAAGKNKGEGTTTNGGGGGSNDATISEQILTAYKNQNYFKALAVAEPTSDEIGDPVWTVTAADLSKAFRKRSLLTHPDKNPNDAKAREAFDVLSECHQKLKNEETKTEALKAFAKKAFEKMCLEDPELRTRAMKMRERKEAGDFQEEIKRQREKGMEKRKRKEEMRMKSKHRRRRDDDDDDDDDDEEARKMRALIEDDDEEKEEKKKEEVDDDDDDDDENAVKRVQAALLKNKKKKKSFLF